MLATGMATLTTSEVAAVVRKSPTATAMLLTRLARSGLVSRLRRGLWLVGQAPVDRYSLAESLTAPFPSYVSLQTAPPCVSVVAGMIEQVPSVIYIASLSRTERIRTSLGVYSIHHFVPELFDGFETRPDGTKLATPEKALFDIAYLSGGRSRLFTHLPELELPARFRRARLTHWIARIEATRRRSMVTARVQRLLDQADGRTRPKKR